ncbi:hypothetical protein [Polynucleobacter necessarius]|uniref:hypothetical protein n=1 Tax=Polynucleobacter necessarius TaxID=576610 RepID=UPI001E54E6C3|nr:hypothetical protein [Polynucleobacter necessarius]
MQKQFIAAEKSILECEQNIHKLSALENIPCFIQPTENHHWLISSKAKPTLQVRVYVNEKTGAVTTLNWRQAFE